MRARLLSKISVLTISAAALYGFSALTPNLASAASFDFNGSYNASNVLVCNDNTGPTTSGGNCGSQTGTNGNMRKFIASGDATTTVKAQAWSTTGDKSPSTNNALESGWLGMYTESSPNGGSDGACCGLGVTNRDGQSGNPNATGDGTGTNAQHTMDNVGRLDMISFLFNKILKPTSITLDAYSYTYSSVTVGPDSDIALYIGNIIDKDGDNDIDEVDVGLTINGKTLAELDTLFDEVGAPDEPITNDGSGDRTATFSTPLTGNFFLLMPNPTTDLDDMLKVGGLTADADIPHLEVAEPMTGALMAGGLFGLGWARRRQARKAQA